MNPLKARQRLIARAICSVVMVLTFAVSAISQIDVSVTNSYALRTNGNSDHWQISVGFDQSFDIPASRRDVENPRQSPVKNPANFYLIDILNGQRISVVYAYYEADRFYQAGVRNVAAGLPRGLVLYLDPSVRLSACRSYHLYIFNLTFEEGKVPNGALQTPIAFPREKCEVGAGKAPGAGSGTATPLSPGAGGGVSVTTPEPEIDESVSTTEAEGREDANFYLSGELTKASGERIAGSVDFKLEYPNLYRIGDRIHEFNPFFELKASNDPGRDPDSLTTGLRWEFPVYRYRGKNLSVPVRRITWRNSPMIEAERDFDNANFIWESRFKFLSRTWMSKHTTFYVRPFVGHELGFNIVSPLEAAEGSFIFRPIAGTTMNLIFPLQRAGLHAIGIEGSYIRRWPLRKELRFQEDADGNLQLLEIGTSPRDYVKGNINVDFTKKFGLTFAYEYGQLPPSFKLIDHKGSVGLTYKSKISR